MENVKTITKTAVPLEKPRLSIAQILAFKQDCPECHEKAVAKWRKARDSNRAVRMDRGEHLDKPSPKAD